MNTNRTLVELQNKNHKVFKKVFTNYYEELVIYANSFLFDKSASEDIVQEVYIYIWENTHKINIKTSIKAYIYAMVRNQCLNYLKTLKITDDLNFIELNASLIIEQDLDFFSTEDKRIVYNQIVLIVDSLPDRMQQIFKLKFLENYKYAEIAEELDISINTVKTQLKRAKFKISQSLISLLILLSNHQ